MNEVSQMEDVYINEHSMAHLKFTATWKDESGWHTVVQHAEKFNVWRDIDLIPAPLIHDVLNKPVSKGELHVFNAGELVPAWQSSQLITLPATNFSGRLPNGESIVPQVGRFYPKGWISGVEGVYSDNMFPTRIVGVWDDKIVVDYNHPLAMKEISLEVDVVDILPPSDEHGGRCLDIVHEFLDNGPGMQLPYTMTSTDFFNDAAFTRLDENDDTIFYEAERKVHHLDEYARNTISDVYGQLIAPQHKVLDLMSSWESHIPNELAGTSITGLGMNAEELQANAQLEHYVVHDLNENPLIPFEDEAFDSVVCTASVEYLTSPLQVFSEINRILKPGGQCIMAFSNRWFPTKSIKLWSELHEFERVGLVAEYFLQSGWNGDINTYTSRGLSRPESDPHYAKTQLSDPVYVVWSQK